MTTAAVNNQASLLQKPLNGDVGFQKSQIEEIMQKQQKVQILMDALAAQYPHTAEVLGLAAEQCKGATASLDKLEKFQSRVSEAKNTIEGMTEQFESLVKGSNLLDLFEAMKKGNEVEIQKQNERCSKLEAQADQLERELNETRKKREELEQMFASLTLKKV